MSLAINRILLQHSEALEQANKAAADAILVELRAMLAPFNFSRHDVTIGDYALMISTKGSDDELEWYSIPGAGRSKAVGALINAGTIVSDLPQPILNHLRGEVL